VAAWLFSYSDGHGLTPLYVPVLMRVGWLPGRPRLEVFPNQWTRGAAQMRIRTVALSMKQGPAITKPRPKRPGTAAVGNIRGSKRDVLESA
jgi:hypothetical protein